MFHHVAENPFRAHEIDAGGKEVGHDRQGSDNDLSDNYKESLYSSFLAQHALPFVHPEVAKHIRMNIETDIGQVVDVLARDKPDDLADFALGIVAGQCAKGIWINSFVFG
jgi:hypothetical protein